MLNVVGSAIMLDMVDFVVFLLDLLTLALISYHHSMQNTTNITFSDCCFSAVADFLSLVLLLVAPKNDVAVVFFFVDVKDCFSCHVTAFRGIF